MDTRTIYLGNDLKVLNFTEDGDKAVIEGRATRFNNSNLNGETVDAKSFATFLKLWGDGKAKVQMNYEHCYDKIIGGVDEITVKDDGLFVRSHLNTAIPFVGEWLIPNIKNGDINSLSTEGYVLNGPDGITWLAKNKYYVKDFILSAIALTTHPADVEATFSMANAIREWELAREARKPKWYIM